MSSVHYMTDKTQATTDARLGGWTHGPLPSQALEQIALAVFTREYPEHLWYDDLMQAQRNDARRFALQMRAAVLADVWTLESAEDTLAEGTVRVLAAGRDVSDQTRHEVRQYAASYLEDLWPVFGPIVTADLNRKVS